MALFNSATDITSLAALIPGDATGGAVTVGQSVTMGTNGATLTLAKLEEAINLVISGPPDLLVMNTRTRVTLSGLSRSSSSPIESRPEWFGLIVPLYNGIPVVVNNNIAITDTQGSNSDCSAIYCLRMSASADIATMAGFAKMLTDIMRAGGSYKVPGFTLNMTLTALKMQADATTASHLIGIRT